MNDAARKEPFETTLSNPGHDNRWTSPCCYSEMGAVGPGVHKCPSCGRQVRCSLDKQPVCLSEIVDVDAGPLGMIDDRDLEGLAEE